MTTSFQLSSYHSKGIFSSRMLPFNVPVDFSVGGELATGCSGTPLGIVAKQYAFEALKDGNKTIIVSDRYYLYKGMKDHFMNLASVSSCICKDWTESAGDKDSLAVSEIRDNDMVLFTSKTPLEKSWIGLDFVFESILSYLDGEDFDVKKTKFIFDGCFSSIIKEQEIEIVSKLNEKGIGYLITSQSPLCMLDSFSEGVSPSTFMIFHQEAANEILVIPEFSDCDLVKGIEVQVPHKPKRKKMIKDRDINSLHPRDFYLYMDGKFYDQMVAYFDHPF